MYELILLSILASFGIAVAAAPIGCILLWQRMAFLGDTIAHASLLGVAIALCCSVPIIFGVLFVAIFLAYFISLNDKIISNDTTMAIIASSCIAIAMIIISMAHQNIELESYLFGDILTVSIEDIIIIYVVSAFTVFFLICRWKKLILVAISEDLADTSGIKSKKLLLEFRIIIACLIGLSMKVVGILLISALLIIPAAAARNFSHTPLQMAMIAILFSLFSSICGVLLSFYYNIIVGPSIIIVAVVCFIISCIKKMLVKN
jgi:zinc transport system permease protein